MNSHKNLLFFNKEGDNLNIKYNHLSDRFEGSILFNENSSDTYKTSIIYTLESIPSFTFEDPGKLALNKFQLFNEYTFDFYGNSYKNESVVYIEPVNSDPSFHSKWVYGEDFDIKFKIGSIIKFETIFLEFSNLDQLYTVVASKKNAILIISSVDNQTFTTNYQTIYTQSNSYNNIRISGVNAIGIYNYINSTTYVDNLSNWNENDFYNKLYKNKKLNIINTKFNDNIYTIRNENLIDLNFYRYSADKFSLNSDLIIEFISLSDRPIVYNGGININRISTNITNGGGIDTFTYTSNSGVDNIYSNITATPLSSTGTGSEFTIVVSGGVVSQVICTLKGELYSMGDTIVIDGTLIGGQSIIDDINITINNITTPIIKYSNRIYFNSFVPNILKPGREFVITNSISNNINLTVSNITNFSNNLTTTDYKIGDHVLYNNKIYECVTAYTHSYGDPNTQYITPLDINYWSELITYIDVNEVVSNEVITSSQLYLTTNKLYFDYTFDTNSDITLASACEKYKDDFKVLNIELYYENSSIYADLIYPSRYAEVNFYNGNLNNLITRNDQIFERVIEVDEVLIPENNYDFSKNHSINIIFDDLDIHGLSIIINKQVYNSEFKAVYNNTTIDLTRSIDKTLRNWLSINIIELLRLGIIPSLSYTGSITSPYMNSIKLTSEFPNVSLYIDDIIVGNGGKYYTEHSTIIFNEIGKLLSLNINNDEFYIESIYNSGIVDINQTLDKWVREYYDYLYEFGILVSSINNMLVINNLYPSREIKYTVNNYITYTPGINSYIIVNKLLGNHGALITSNEIVLPIGSYTQSLIDAGFSTGMLLSINNDSHTWVNTEYNILYLDNSTINLSYEGPFWGTTQSNCKTSPYLNISFNNGFGQTACGGTGSTGSYIQGGPFNTNAFSNAFSILNNPNTYIVNNYNLQSYQGTSNLIDIIHIQLSNSIYLLGDDVIVMDSHNANYISTIPLPTNNNKKLFYNKYNNLLYCISSNNLYIINVLINSIVDTISFNDNISDMITNSVNGDIYISFDSTNLITILDRNNNLIRNIDSSDLNLPTGITKFGSMCHNIHENCIYVTTDSFTDSIIKIDGVNRSIISSYGINISIDKIIYEPIDRSVYILSNNGLNKIINNSIQVISGVPTSNTFGDIIFDNITNGVLTSTSNTDITNIDVISNNINYTTYNGNYGYLCINQYDSCAYLSSISSNTILVIDVTNGSVIENIPTYSNNDKIIYNPDRNSVWLIQPNINTVTEVEVILNINVIPNNGSYINIDDNNYGTLDKNYKPYSDIWLKSREYLRRPRENYIGESSVEYYWKWYSDDIPEFFLYDFSGDQLPMNTPYSYNGTRPLNPAVLNKIDNTDVNKRSLPEYQKTIFDVIKFNLSHINDINDISSEPEALPLFIGFKSEDEGALRSVLQLYKRENVSYTYNNDLSNPCSIRLETINPSDNLNKRGQITIDQLSNDTFTNKGFKPGQLISITIKDVSNSNNQYISQNNGVIGIIDSIFYKTIILKFLNDSDFLYYEDSIVNDYPINGSSTNLSVCIKVLDKEIARFNTYAQTEIEDIRYQIELSNNGKLINSDNVFIFKDYDILEGGIDWIFLNKKRKEMLLNKHLIFPYIGSYKSIINAINYFGYNDLILSEYFRNIDINSSSFLKLTKVDIPDIFDNTVDGWSESDFIKNITSSDKYEETNQFGLSYNITDIDGNNILSYTIDEIIIKLQGLKYWLSKNVIPLTHKIVDITGRLYYKNSTNILQTSYDISIFNTRQRLSPIYGKLNEAYLMPINTGSTVYNCILDLFLDDNNDSPDYYDIKVRTYRIYKEWSAFTLYNIGDRVVYYNKIYESVVNNNKINDPRRFNLVETWNDGTIYSSSNTVEYKGRIYSYKGSPNTISNIAPINDPSNWLDISRWIEVELEPVQTLYEYRVISNLKPFSFTIDSNIDPYIVIEISSDNGYGAIYSDNKAYEVRSTKDLTQSNVILDKIGKFIPIYHI